MDFWTYLALIMGVIGTVVTIAAIMKHSPITGIIGIFSIIIGIVLYFIITPQSIEIIYPLTGNTIRGVVNTADNQLSINDVKVKVAHPIKNNDKIFLLMNVSGSNKCWVTGNKVSRAEFTNDNIGNFGYVTFGETNDGNSNYEMHAIVSSYDLSTSDKLTDSNKYSKCSSIAMFQKNGYSITRTK